MTRRYLRPLLFLALTAPALAQTDSLQVSYSTEPSDSSEFRWREPYRYLTRANVEEKTLVKVGFGPFALGSSVSFDALLNNEALVERKLRPAWSVLGGVNFGVSYQTYENPAWRTDRRDFSLATNLVARVGFWNYYAIGQRIRNRKSANNFSNNYWGVEWWVPAVVWNWSRSRDFENYPGPGQPWPQIERQMTYWGGRTQVQVYWGLQRRLGRRGYLDFSVAARYNPFMPRRYVASPQPFDALTASPNGRSLFGLGRFQIHPTLRIGLGW